MNLDLEQLYLDLEHIYNLIGNMLIGNHPKGDHPGAYDIIRTHAAKWLIALDLLKNQKEKSMIKNELMDEITLALNAMATLDSEIQELNINIKDSSYVAHAVDLNSFRQIKQMMKSWLQRLAVAEPVSPEMWEYVVEKAGGFEALKEEFENRPKPLTVELTLQPGIAESLRGRVPRKEGSAPPTEEAILDHITHYLENQITLMIVAQDSLIEKEGEA